MQFTGEADDGAIDGESRTSTRMEGRIRTALGIKRHTTGVGNVIRRRHGIGPADRLRVAPPALRRATAGEESRDMGGLMRKQTVQVAPLLIRGSTVHGRPQ